LLLLIAGAIPTVARAADAEAEKTRQTWENLIQYYGEEETGRFSLRVLDKETNVTGSFVFLSFWKYDRDTNGWTKLKDGPIRAKVVLPQDKPKDSPKDSQVLVELPITIKDVGVYYAKWTVNGVAGGSFTRIGPHAPRGSGAGIVAKKGEILTDVPIDPNHAEVRAIPEPSQALKDR
jgi:hypothetical protein